MKRIEDEWEKKEFPHIVQKLCPVDNIPDLPEMWKKDIHPFVKIYEI